MKDIPEPGDHVTRDDCGDEVFEVCWTGIKLGYHHPTAHIRTTGERWCRDVVEVAVSELHPVPLEEFPCTPI